MATTLMIEVSPCKGHDYCEEEQKIKENLKGKSVVLIT